MRLLVNAIFALQTRQGLVFGCAREIDGDHLVFQVPGVLTPGEVLDWRMQLVGRPEMITGALRVETQRVGQQPGQHPVFDGRIVAMTEANRTMLQSWLEERSSRSKEPAPRASPLLASRIKSKLGSSIRRAGRRYGIGNAPSGGAGTPGTPSGKTSAPVAGREAITAALKASLSRTSRAPIPQQRPVSPPAPRLGAIPPPPGWEDEPSAPAPQKRPASPARESWPPPEDNRPGPITRALDPPKLSAATSRTPVPQHKEVAAPAPAPIRLGTDPAIAIRPGSRPVLIHVRYRSKASFARDHEAHLRGSGLYLAVTDLEDLQTRGTRALVRLDLPSGANVVVPGEVVAPMSQGVGLALDFTAAQRRMLAEEAGVNLPPGG